MDETCEFPPIPENFNGLVVKPNKLDLLKDNELILQNRTKKGVLFKVKTSSNRRIRIDDCADILLPGNQVTVPIKKLVDNITYDQLFVIYTLVGPQWLNEKMSAFRAWERVKRQGIPTKCLIIKMHS